MSTVGIKYHNEDIHNIIRKPMSPTIKSPRYKSKASYETGLKSTAGRKYNGHQTFGLAHYEPPEAKNFLRKGTGRILPIPGKFINKKEFKCTNNCKSSSIPKPIFESRKQARKNFVKENIKKAVALQPKEPVPKKVETPRGTVKDMGHLIQMIKIRQSEEYGKIPKYLYVRKQKEEMRKKKQELEMLALEDYNKKIGVGNVETSENVYMIDSETRQKILHGLKENWNELSKQFLKLPVMTDTWPKIKRKMWLEKEIEQLEKDIKLVESHPYIYLERQMEGSNQGVIAENNRSHMPQQEQRQDHEREQNQETKLEENLETEEKTQAKQSSGEETAEEKREDDKEEEKINVLNY